MFYRRSLSCLVALAVALSLTPRGSAATTSPTEQGSSDQQLYQAYSEFFFVKRDLDLALEMSLRESFLAWLYEGINVEVAARSKEDPVGTLTAITPPELTSLNEESYAFPDSLLEAPLRIRYLAYEESQKTEFNHKYLQARLIKDRLIRAATPEQKKRMFKRDLESALISYRDNFFRETILRCDELIDRYGYGDLADIIFYRAECAIALQLFEQAADDYRFVVENSTEPWFRSHSLEKLISLAGDRGAVTQVADYWDRYQAELAGSGDAAFWGVAERTGRYLMAGQEWAKARSIFDSIPNDVRISSSALLHSGDCSLALLELDDAERRYREFLVPAKGKKISDEDARLANLKLGYVDYLRGRFDVAFQTFDGIAGSGEAAERGQLSAIWCLYRLSAYQQVIDRCNAYLLTYPQSQYLYEIHNLIGFSEEMLGRGDTALENYRVVMSALDDRQDFYDFNRELGAINSALGKLQELEGLIFLGGERDLFPEYLKIRRELQRLVDGVRFARALKTTPFLREVIKEQKDVFASYQDQADLEDQIYELQDAKLLEEYRKSVSVLIDIGSELSAGIRYYMAQKSLIQREQDKLYENQAGDSLKVRLEREWAATQQAVDLVRQYLKTSRGSADAKTMVEMTGLETHLVGIQDRILRVRTSLRKFGQEAVVSNLDLWSDFAYQRYTYGGLNFDFLYSKESRIEELDQYIRQVGTLLQERDAARRDTVTLAADLVPAGKTGDPPYFAPAVPLWGMTMPVSPLSDDTTPTESIESQPEMADPEDGAPMEMNRGMELTPEERAPSMEETVPPTDETPEAPDETRAGDSTVDEEGSESPEEAASEESAPVEEIAPDVGETTGETIPTEPAEVMESEDDATGESEPAPEIIPEESPAFEPGEMTPELEILESEEPDSLGRDTTGMQPVEPGAIGEPQTGPSVP